MAKATTPSKHASKSKSKLTDAERHKRFVEMARQVEASDDPKNSTALSPMKWSERVKPVRTCYSRILPLSWRNDRSPFLRG